LSQDSILASAEKRLNFKVLFNPFKEKLDLPSGFIDIGNRSG
jgi:hypothetical protein